MTQGGGSIPHDDRNQFAPDDNVTVRAGRLSGEIHPEISTTIQTKTRAEPARQSSSFTTYV